MNILKFNADIVHGRGGHESTPNDKKLRFAGLLTFFLIASAGSAVGADLTIDNFTSGHFRSPVYRSGAGLNSSQNGSMLGGNRYTGLLVCTPPNCGFLQPVSYEFKRLTSTTGAFFFNAGFGAKPRIDMYYGKGAPMSANFTPYDRIRVNFLGLTQPLNFNILAFTGTTWAQNGCNIGELNRPFSIELPFTGFVISGSNFTWSNITLMDNIFQSGSAIGGVELAIDSIVLSNTAMAGAQVCALKTPSQHH